MNKIMTCSGVRWNVFSQMAQANIERHFYLHLKRAFNLLCAFFFYYSCFSIDQICFFYANANILRVCAAAHIKLFQTYCLNCAVICFSYIHINTALCRILMLVNIRNGVQFTTTQKWKPGSRMRNKIFCTFS